MIEIRMPQWGMNMAEGVIVRWLKEVGDEIEAGEPLVEIEAAKSSSTLDSPVSGTIAKLLVTVDDAVPVQTVIALIEARQG